MNDYSSESRRDYIYMVQFERRMKKDLLALALVCLDLVAWAYVVTN